MWGWAFLVVAGAVLLLSTAAEGQTVPVMGAQFPAANAQPAVARVGADVYAFGGWQNPGSSVYRDTIWRYHLPTDDLVALNATLPVPMHAVATVRFGDAIYLLGGHKSPPYVSDILRFDPSNGTLTDVGVDLPSAGGGTAATDGKAIYVFQGPGVKPVFRYDPINNTVTSLAVNTPSEWGAAVGTDEGIFYFGGHIIGGPNVSNKVWKLDPAVPSITQVATLPQAWGYSGVAYTGDLVYLVGGGVSTCTPTCARATSILTFDPATLATGTFSGTLPVAQAYIGAVGVPGGAYGFAASTSSANPGWDRIVCLHCGTPPACASTTAIAGQKVKVDGTGGTKLYDWSTAEGTPTSGSGASFNVTFAAAGTYTVGIVGGGTASCTVQVSWPALACSASPGQVLTGQTVVANATGGSGTYSWSVPGGSPSAGSGASFSTAFPTAGTKTIQVAGGYTSTCTVTVEWGPFACGASPNPAATGDAVTVTAYGKAEATPTWSVPTGSPAAGTGSTFETTFASTGVKTFTVAAGPTATCTVQVWPPLSCPAAPHVASTGQSIAWTASGGSGDYAWSAPAGSPSSGSGPSFTTSYGTPGAKVVTLAAGLVRQCGIQVWPPLACSAVPSPAVVGEPVNLSGSGGSGSYRWSSPHEPGLAGSGPSFTATFASNGTKTVVVSAALEATCPVAVYWPLRCSLSSATLGQPVALRASGGTGVYSWSSATSSPSAASGPLFWTTFPWVGSHFVTLESPPFSTSCEIVVREPTQASLPYPDEGRARAGAGQSPPQAAFAVECVSSGTVRLDGTGAVDTDGLVLAWSWDFGDGSMPRGGPLQWHTLDERRRYTVALTVWDDQGLSDRVQRTFEVDACARVPENLAVPVQPLARDEEEMTEGNGAGTAAEARARDGLPGPGSFHEGAVPTPVPGGDGAPDAREASGAVLHGTQGPGPGMAWTLTVGVAVVASAFTLKWLNGNRHRPEGPEDGAPQLNGRRRP
jgi:hypothetical protein